LSQIEASISLGLSLRQVKRLWKRFKADGDVGVIHGLRGKRGNRAADSKTRKRVMGLYMRKYKEKQFGATLASECMRDCDGVKVAVSTLRDWLRSAGLRPGRRKGCKHRSRRERRACIGELVQMDGSTHDWFGIGIKFVLYVMVDDATGRLFCRFYESEDTRSAFDLFGRYVEQYGLPVALYVDKDSIYTVNNREPTTDEALRGIKPLTQFGRAMDKLNVKVILAHSPQAKGRVERMNGTLQDRLIKMLWLEGIKDIQAANRYLDKTFLAGFNKKFDVASRSETDLHRRVPKGLDLSEVLCPIHERTASQDWCIQHEGRVFQIGVENKGLRLAGKKVQMFEMASGEVKIKYQGRRLTHCVELATRPAKTGNVTLKAAARVKLHQPYKPPKREAWRRFKIKPASPPVQGVGRGTRPLPLPNPPSTPLKYSTAKR
jgi:hypothetical protein